MNKNNFGFLRVSAIAPEVVVGDVKTTTINTVNAIKESALQQNVKLMAFPELSLTGYTASDLFHQTTLQKAVVDGIEYICKETKSIDATIVVGAPLVINGLLFNTAVVIEGGKVVGIVPKTYLPTNNEFYETRWFASAHDLTVSETEILGEKVPVGTDLLFTSKQDSSIVFAIEICEDLWTPVPPSSFYSVAGASLIINLSASNELVGKAAYRRKLVEQQSARCVCAYLYSCAGPGESTTDVVFGGHCMIAENGSLLSESKRFETNKSVACADIDIEQCIRDRMKTTSFVKSSKELLNKTFRRIPVSLSYNIPEKLLRPLTSHPFIPGEKSQSNAVCEDIFNIQSTALRRRLQKTGIKKVVLGLSGGLDSTLAFIVCVKTFEELGYPMKDIYNLTMPGFGTTTGTKSNAIKLAEATKTTIEEISIVDGVTSGLKEISHDTKKQDITYENAQARYRTMLLMNKANQIGGLVVGTGDLSESALGWCTYTGDQASHYHINAGIPKTLVKYVVDWVAQNKSSETLKKVLNDILDTPISPELKKAKKGKIAQKTEEVIGPYELHDFFLYHFIRHGSGPKKIVYLATQAFKEKYSTIEIKKWLRLFIDRFFKNQFKRSAAPDGPKVGSVSLSQRGDWRMPSDASAKEWMRELDV